MSDTSRKGSQDRRPGSRRQSNHFSLEELSEDDIGYDADIEVVRPEYEDAESSNEDDAQDDDSSTNSEDRLAHRLRGLYCDPNMVSSDPEKNPKKGRKRMSKDMEGPKVMSSVRNGRADLEIMELSVNTDAKHPAKRQRNSLTRSKATKGDFPSISKKREETGVKSDSSTLASSPNSTEGAAVFPAETQDVEMTG